jgi:hypothetical protein
VENVIVDSIDGRLLSLLDFPAWNLEASPGDIISYCDSLAFPVTLGDSDHSQTLDFKLNADALGDTLTVTAALGDQTFLLLKSNSWCHDLGMQ